MCPWTVAVYYSKILIAWHINFLSVFSKVSIESQNYLTYHWNCVFGSLPFSSFADDQSLYVLLFLITAFAQEAELLKLTYVFTNFEANWFLVLSFYSYVHNHYHFSWGLSLKLPFTCLFISLHTNVRLYSLLFNLWKGKMSQVKSSLILHCFVGNWNCADIIASRNMPKC